jgi:muramoyltetrapeptide carboxypeptidase
MTQPLSIGVIAPSGYAADISAFDRGLARLRALGHTVKDFSADAPRHQRFAATDEQRIAQIHAAARDPDIKLVMALRGGYGLSRLLPQINFELLASSGKQWVGHSDFTALQLGLLATTGATSFAGPMICDDFSRDDISDFTHRHFWECITSATHRIEVAATGNPTVSAQGKLWGGNLAMLCHLAGTRWMPQVDGGILFVEDVNEHPYRLERMLLQLAYAGVLDRQQALVLGDFSGYKLSDYDNGYDFAAMLDYLRGRLGLPVLQGLPFGHIRDKVTLAVGAECVLESDKNKIVLQMSGYPSLD